MTNKYSYNGIEFVLPNGFRLTSRHKNELREIAITDSRISESVKLYSPIYAKIPNSQIEISGYPYD